MKALRILTALALAAGLFVSCFEEKDQELLTLDELLEKSKQLKGNTYVVQKKGGKAETRSFSQEWSMWERMPMTDPETDETTQYVTLSLEDADADGGTRGGAYFCLPEAVIGKVQSMTEEFFKENPWASVMAFTFKDPEAGHTGGEITAKAGGDGEGAMFGNMKQDGSCKVLEVEYEPANAIWDWADLEIDSNTETFNYYPATHTIAINTLAPHADAHVLGVQVKFRLKSNHNVYDYVYVNLNESPRN